MNDALKDCICLQAHSHHTTMRDIMAQSNLHDQIIMSKLGPTHVLQYGLDSLITDQASIPLNGHKKVIFLIPGNPGVVTFYKYFMRQLYERLQIPIIAVSHVGHIKQGINHLKERVTLKRQVEHKLDFIETYIPHDVQIIFVGHSIGAYIALEVSRLLERRERVVHQILLFPSIERMDQTPGANDLRVIVFFRFFLYIIMFFLSLLRDEILVNMNAFLQGLKPHQPDCIIEASLQMVDWKVIRNVIVMAQDEIVQVQERCDRFIGENRHKLTFVYCLEDRWSPLKFYRDLKRAHDTDIVILDTAVHAFVVDTRITRDVVALVTDRVQRAVGKKPLPITES